MTASRAKGTAWETTIVDYLRINGAPHAERRALNGAKDRGDIAGIPGVVIEAKSATRVELAAWLDEAEAERANDHADVGVVWIKRRGRTSPAAGFVVMSGAQLLRLLASAGYTAAPPEPGIRQRVRDQGPWHCAERGCPGGHMLPNGSCADRPDQPEG